jgi:hypothetical protein
MRRLAGFFFTPNRYHKMSPKDDVKHTVSTASTPYVPSPIDGCPLEVALIGLPFELPDGVDVWLLPPAEEVLKLVDAAEVVLPMTLVATLLASVAADIPAGESVSAVAAGVEAV